MFKMAILLLILVVAVPISFRCWQRMSARARPKRASVITAAKPEFSAVKVAVDLNCCQAVRDMSKQAFLTNSAPSLPVPECDAMSCRCRYTYLEDRREGERRSPVLSIYERFTTPEQWANRGVRGRRKDDVDEAKRAEKVLKTALNRP